MAAIKNVMLCTVCAFLALIPLSASRSMPQYSSLATPSSDVVDIRGGGRGGGSARRGGGDGGGGRGGWSDCGYRGCLGGLTLGWGWFGRDGWKSEPWVEAPPPPTISAPRPIVPSLGAHTDWCLSRYRSYNPATNRYLSRVGDYKTCRSPFR